MSTVVMVYWLTMFMHDSGRAIAIVPIPYRDQAQCEVAAEVPKARLGNQYDAFCLPMPKADVGAFIDFDPSGMHYGSRRTY